MSIQDTIREQVTTHPVVLYMKGTPQFPQCGFSSVGGADAEGCGVDEFFSVNVLADAEIRQGIKDYANWPTIPAALRQRRIRRRLRHHARDVRVGRIAAAAVEADRVSRVRHRQSRTTGRSRRFHAC